jgi:hypothetical protein
MAAILCLNLVDHRCDILAELAEAAGFHVHGTLNENHVSLL